MDIVKEEITEARYKELEAMSYSEQHQALFPNGVPEHWAMGYGYYGHALVQVGDEYMVQYKIGSSCE